MNTSGIFLCGFVAVFLPLAVQAQAPAASMDSWRVGFGAQLDQEMAKLNLRTSSDVDTLLRLDRSTPDARVFKPAPLESPLKTMIDSLLDQQGLPARLISIVTVESGFNSAALSPKGALGLWQLMPDTARRYGLAVDAHGDERLDPVKATVAAAAYLRELYGRFQNWPLTLAAYNAGEHRVQQAIDRVGTRDFWTLSRELALPEETRRYVPKVLSVAGSGFGGPSPASNLLPSALSTAGRMLTFENNPTEKSHIVFATVSP